MGGEGGAVLLNQAINRLDLLYWFTGSPNSILYRALTKMHKIEAEYPVSALLDDDFGYAFIHVSTVQVPLLTRIGFWDDNGAIVSR